MSNRSFWITIIGIIVAFIGGFLLANSLNRNEMYRLQAENEAFKKNPAQASTNPANPNQQQPTLSEEEIRQQIAKADASPTDITFQRDLGVALYRYGGSTNNPQLIAEATRLLKRVHDANPKEYEIIVVLGNAFFDIAAMRRDAASYKTARDYYQKALDQKPDDGEVRGDLGSTFLFTDPPDIARAMTELQKSLQQNPRNERSLQFLVQGYIKQKNLGEAQKALDRLKGVNPSNPMIPSLTAQITTGAPEP